MVCGRSRDKLGLFATFSKHHMHVMENFKMENEFDYVQFTFSKAQAVLPV
jgi:hypothetical protein